jgi:4-hydroxybenzoate polyprenyltransferase
MADRDFTAAVRSAAPFAPSTNGESAYERSEPFAGQRRPWSIAADSSEFRLFANGLAAPLHHRLRRGEGGLFVVNATLALKGHSLGEALGLTLASLVCLLSLYLFNDVVDARDDQHNPKKDHLLAGFYVRERRAFLASWLLMSGFAVVASALVDARAAVWVLAVSLINVAYSLFCKKVPLLDVVWVGVWGGAYASIVTDAAAWVVMVGAMTAVCHIYQISEDRDADAASGFATSAMLAAPLRSSLQVVLTGMLVATAWTVTPGAVALTFAVFFAYWLAWHNRPRTAWMLAKTHFAVAWAYLLMRG